MEQVVVTDEHRWLNKFLGDWSYECTCSMGPESGEVTFKGSEHVRKIGDFWIQGESKSTMPDGSPGTMITTVGFDPKKGKFVGTWTGSMMTHLFVYEGWLEYDGQTLVLESIGPCMMDPTKERTYRDITEFKSDDHRAFHSEMLNDDGSWTKIMGFDLYRVPVSV